MAQLHIDLQAIRDALPPVLQEVVDIIGELDKVRVTLVLEIENDDHKAE